MNFGWCSAYSHRTIEIGRDIWRLNPNALLRRGSIEQVAWGWVQLGFVSLQGWRMFSSLCGLPHPVSDYPHSVFKTPKKLKWNLLYFIWLFIASGPFTGYHWEESCWVLLFFTPPVPYLYALMKCTHAHPEKPFWSQGQTVPALSVSPCTADAPMGCILQP